MLEYLVQRLAISAVTLVVISVIVFTGVRMIPGDPARVMGGTDADEAGLAEIRAKYGLNDRLPVQYFRWVGLALRGDLGESIRTRESVVTTVATTPILDRLNRGNALSDGDQPEAERDPVASGPQPIG